MIPKRVRQRAPATQKGSDLPGGHLDSGWLSWNSSSTPTPRPGLVPLLLDMRLLAGRSGQRAASTRFSLHSRTPFLRTVKHGDVQSRWGGCLVLSGKGKHRVAIPIKLTCAALAAGGVGSKGRQGAG